MATSFDLSRSDLPAESLRLAVAPMMEWTDRHCRRFHRILAPRALLYTEMVTTGALLHGPRDRLLAHDPQEQPLALQLGGCDPAALASCSRLATVAGFAEVNLNLGCPSDRVQQGRIGACLMLEGPLVADCIKAMRDATPLPVTIKCRLGVDAQDSFAFLQDLVGLLAEAGCGRFIVHARKAILSGLSPAQNRSVPPLDHDRVRRLKAVFPQLRLIVNGGITGLAQAQALLAPSAAGPALDGVMLGRAAYQNPWLLPALSQALQQAPGPASREAALAAYLPYVTEQLRQGVRLHAMSRHLLGLFNGMPGARRFRQQLSSPASRGQSLAPLLSALTAVTGESTGAFAGTGALQYSAAGEG